MVKKKRKYYGIDPDIGLPAAILRVAAIDYEKALRAKNENPLDEEAIKVVEELEKFFLSKWGQFLSNYNGELIIEMCRQIVCEGG